MDLSGGTSMAPPTVYIELNVRTSLQDKAKIQDEKSTQAGGGTDMYY